MMTPYAALFIVIALGLALLLVAPDDSVLADMGAVLAVGGFLAIPTGIAMGYLPPL